MGSELSLKLVEGGSRRDRHRQEGEAFIKYPPGDKARQMVGLGFDRDVLEAAGIKDADAFVAVSSGDNSNIVSARVALEHYHVPKVIARIYDPRRAEIYERLNIPTIATTTWGTKQIELMLFHDRQEVRESLGGGDLRPPPRPGPGASRRQDRSPRERRRQGPGRGRLARRRRVHPHRREHVPERATTSQSSWRRTAWTCSTRSSPTRPGSTTDEGRRHGSGSGRAAPRRPTSPTVGTK